MDALTRTGTPGPGKYRLTGQREDEGHTDEYGNP